MIQISEVKFLKEQSRGGYFMFEVSLDAMRPDYLHNKRFFRVKADQLKELLGTLLAEPLSKATDAESPGAS